MVIKLILFLWSIVIYADVYDCRKDAFLESTKTLQYAVGYMEDKFDAIEEGTAGDAYVVYQDLTQKVMSTEQLQEYVRGYCQGERQGQEEACAYFANIIRFAALRSHRNSYEGVPQNFLVFNRDNPKEKKYYHGALKNYAIVDQQSFNDIIDNCFKDTKGALEGRRAHKKRFVITGDGLFKEEDWITGFMHGYHLQSLPEDLGLLQDLKADGFFKGIYECAIDHDLGSHEHWLQERYRHTTNTDLDGLFRFLRTVWPSACKNKEAFEPVKLILFSMLHEAVGGEQCVVSQQSRLDSWAKHWKDQRVKHFFQEHFLCNKSSLYPTTLESVEGLQENMKPVVFACYKKRGDNFLNILPEEDAAEADDVVMAILLYWYHQYLEQFWMEVIRVGVL